MVSLQRELKCRLQIKLKNKYNTEIYNKYEVTENPNSPTASNHEIMQTKRYHQAIFCVLLKPIQLIRAIC